MCIIKRRLLLVVVGESGGGKDELCKYAAEKFSMDFASSSDCLRQYIRDNGLGDTTPANMNRVSTLLRRELGHDFPIPMMLAENDSEHLIIGGPRVVAEVETLRAHGAIIIAVAPLSVRVRYDRAQGRNRDGDKISFDEFAAFCKLEAANSDPGGHNVDAVIAMADYHISNDGTLEEFRGKIDEVMEKIVPQLK